VGLPVTAGAAASTLAVDLPPADDF